MRIVSDIIAWVCIALYYAWVPILAVVAIMAGLVWIGIMIGDAK